MAWRRRLLRALAILALLLVGLVTIVAIVSQTSWFRERLRRLAVKQAQDAIQGTLAIGAIDGNLATGVALRDVSIVQGDTTVVQVGRVQLSYSVGDILSSGRVVQQIVIERPVIDAVRTPEGWNVARILKPRPPSDPDEPRATFTLPDVRVIDAQVRVREIGVPETPAIPRRIDGLAFEGGIASTPQELGIDVRKLTFRAGQPELDLRSLAGRIVNVREGWRFETLAVRTAESALDLAGSLTRSPSSAPWTFDLDMKGAPASLPEIGRFVPAASFPLHPHLAVGVTGTLDALGLDVDVTASEAGRAQGRLTLDATGPTRALEGRLAVADLDLAPILKTPDATGRITGDATFDLTFPSATEGMPVDGSFAFRGPAAGAYGYQASNVRATGALDGQVVRLDASADAYGGRATTAGTITRPGGAVRELALDLRGRVDGVDLRRMPPQLRVPSLETDLDGTYRVQGPLSAVSAEVALAASTVEGAAVSEGTTGRFARTPQGFTFGAAGTVAGLDLQRLGEALQIAALTEPRFAGAVNGAFEVSGEQRGRAGLALEATGTLTDTTVLGGQLPAMTVTATLDGPRLDVAAKGRVEGYDLAVLTGNETLTGTLAGDVDTRVTFGDTAAVDLETIGVDGTFTLDRPTLLNVPFQAVTADLALADGVATIRRLDARGDGFSLTGSGALGLGPGDVSDFTYHLDADSLVQPAKIADLPITGAAITDGRVTGTREEFLVTGTIAGDQVAYGDTAAAGTVTAQYAVRLPDFDAARLDVQASVDAQQVSVAGQVLPTAAGTVGYADRTVRFDVTGTDAVRTLAARGTLALEDERQRLRLDRLDVARNGVQWGLAPGTEARADITSRQMTLAPLLLTHDDERIEAEGTIGIADDAASSLRVTAAGVDIGDVLTLAAQDVDADGVLDLHATLGGTRQQPVADAQIDLTHGRVRNIDIQRLGGRVNFDGSLAILDLELIKDAHTRLTARGIVPRTIVDGRSDEHVAPTAADLLDVAIVSTPIDLALAEGVTPYVREIGGQAQVDVRITGSGRDPHIEGAVFLVDGAFRVPLTGVTYRNTDAVLMFEEERVVISEMGIESDDGDLLTVEGELGLGREQGRAVSLRVKGEDFRVIDNAYGLLDLHADLTIAGTLLAPVIEGGLAVSDGRLELDQILPQVATSTYATEAEYQGIPTERLLGAIVPDILGADEAPPVLTPGTNTFTISERVSAVAPPVASTGGEAGASAPSPLGTPATGTQEAQAATSPAGDEPVPDAQAAPSRGVFADAALNIAVRIPDNLVLRGTDIEAARMSIGDLNATIGGEFRVAKAAGKPVVLLGAVNTVRGTYSYQGRQFEIVRDGQIAFRGDEAIDPRLDITAQRTIQGVEARVRIQGTAREPELALSSDPPLDQGDILALIIFNQPLNQLGTGQQTSLSQRAGGIAAGFVVSPLAQALGSSLDLDQFEVQTTDPTGRVNPALVIGQQVTQDMFLRFRQQFGNQQVSQFLLEYRLADFLRLQGNVAEGDGLTAGNRSLTQRIERYGMDLVFHFSF